MEFSQIIRWKRFSHSPYAVFCSLHKVINVGVLSVAMIANADAKSHNKQEPEESPVYYEMLDDVEVTAGKEGISINGPDSFSYTIESATIQTAPRQSVNDLLKHAPEIDVRQRGAFGVQTDISIKGSTPEQTRFTLNGVNISSPQTGHLSADFPISADALSRIELIEGHGESETVNLVAKPDTASGYKATAIVGMCGLLSADNTISIRNERNAHLVNGSISRSDGATPNSDFGVGRFYYFGQTCASPIKVEWQVGYSRKSFGANTFYSPAYDNQWERTNRVLSSAKIETSTPIRLSTLISWCRDYDHFQLIRNEHFGENHHRTDAFTISPEMRKRWKDGESSFRVNYRHETILSTNLGTPLGNDSVKIFGSELYYKKRQKRDMFGAILSHQQKVKRWVFDAGLHYTQSEDISRRHDFLPFLNTTYGLRRIRLTLSVNKSVRIPTFTDLFYKSPTTIGNVGLKSEKKTTIQLKAKHRRKGFENELYLFHTIGKEMIDWVMYTEEDTYHSANFGLKSIGFGYHGEIKISEMTNLPIKIGLGYQHIRQRREDNIFIYKSLYALEYLRNKATASITAQPFRNLEICFDTRFMDRVGHYIRYENRSNTGMLQAYVPYCVSDLEIRYKVKRAKLFMTINNLFNQIYVDFGNIPQPGIYAQAGVSIKI